jgi:uroporphyrinogen-III synthase
MKVLITRPLAQSHAFAEALRKAGLEPVFFPVIEIRPLKDQTALESALSDLGNYAWVVFTSVNAVEVVFAALQAGGHLPLIPAQDPKIAAIGPKTAEALHAHGISPDFVPEEYVAEAILPGLGALNGRRVLLPRAEIAREALPQAIRSAGGDAHEVTVYRTLPAVPAPAALAALRNGMDWITFTSPSTVQNFVEIVQAAGLDPFDLPRNPRIACIGPVTAQAARLEGFAVHAVADVYTTEGLIQVISPENTPIRK